MSDENEEGLAVADDVSSEPTADDSLNDGFEPDHDATFSEPDDGGGEPDDAPSSEGEEPTGEAPSDTEGESDAVEAGTEDWLSGQVRSAGEMLGMSEIEMRQFGNAQALESAIIDEANLRTQEESAGQPAATEREKFDLQLSPDDFDPAVIKAFGRLNDHHDGRTQQLEGALVGMADLLEKFMQRTQDSELDRWMDTRFASLGDEYEDIFGTGTVDTIDRSSKEYENRVALREELSSRLKNGQDASRTQSFERSVRARFGDRSESLARKKITASVKKRGRQSIARPTRRTAPPQATTEQDIVQKLRERMRDKGLLEE